MKREVAIPASIAVLSLAFVLPRDSQAMAPKNPPTPASESSAAVQSDAARRVIAQATLVKPLDARKIQSSQQFQATLSDKVQLKNGPELPRGTILIGTMAAGDAQAGGTSKLVLRFTVARSCPSKQPLWASSRQTALSAMTRESGPRNLSGLIRPELCLEWTCTAKSRTSIPAYSSPQRMML
jgi:hypothetical protein